MTYDHDTLATIAREFPDFDLATLPATFPEGFSCAAWRNDACPIWLEGAPDRETRAGDLSIGIDYADPARREFPDAKRYFVTFYDMDGTWQPVLFTDQWVAVETLVARVRAERQADAVTASVVLEAKLHLNVGWSVTRIDYDAEGVEIDRGSLFEDYDLLPSLEEAHRAAWRHPVVERLRWSGVPVRFANAGVCQAR